jgi:hypothetical protein
MYSQNDALDEKGNEKLPRNLDMRGHAFVQRSGSANVEHRTMHLPTLCDRKNESDDSRCLIDKVPAAIS